MESSNRSGLQCFEHPREQYTNFCANIDCLKPLCPDCVEVHAKLQHPQDIESWKHCLSRAAIKTKTTLEELRLIYQSQRQRTTKSPESVEAENLRRLQALRQRYHRLVDEIFNAHETTLRNQVRQHYRVDQPDTSKLKMAIEEIEKILMKLAHPSSTLPALKKALLLDQRALLDFFSHLKNSPQQFIREEFFSENVTAGQALRSALQRSISIDLPQIAPLKSNSMPSSPARKYSNHVLVGEWLDPFQPLKITMQDYFVPECKEKWLHFFIPCSFELKLLRVQEAERGQWRSMEFRSKKELPCYFKSIATPTGDIYLTGGSEGTNTIRQVQTVITVEDLRCREIYRLNFERSSLDLVSNMLIERSSHSVCYLNNKIYLIGGFSGPDGDVTRDCQVLDLQTMSCSRIAPLNTPSANSAAAAFANQFIFKFGGIFNKTEGNSLIQMYSIKSNRWIVVGIQSGRGVPSLELLSFSAAVQINENDLLVFGGYDNSEMERPERLCYALRVNVEKNTVMVRNYNTNPLPYAEGFWNNNPIVQGRRVYGLQNVTDQENELTALADERRVVIFNGERWL